MTTKNAAIILWDIDGTLLTAGNGGLDHYHRAIGAVVPNAQPPTIETHGKTDWQVILELLAASGLARDLAPAVSAALDEDAVVFLESARLELLPNVPQVLGMLARMGLRNGLLTGNSERRARNKLAGAGLDPVLIDWGACFFGARSAVRPDLARAARQVFPDTPLLVVGDTPFDGTAAAAAGIDFLAVTTGRYDASAFAASGALAVLAGLDAAAAETIAGIAASRIS